MSLEQSIADLQTQAGLLLDLPQTIANTATAQIVNITAAYNTTIGQMGATFYVNQATGSDLAEGTEAAPLKTIGKAVSLVPRGGVCTVRLLAPYHVDADINVDARSLIIAGHNSIRHQITFERILLATTPELRFLKALNIANGGGILCYEVSLVVPAMDTYGAYGAANFGVFNNTSSINAFIPRLCVMNCDVVIPATPYGPLLSGAFPWQLIIHSVSYSGAITSPLGRISRDQTNTAGVATNSLAWLHTNLTSI